LGRHVGTVAAGRNLLTIAVYVIGVCIALATYALIVIATELRSIRRTLGSLRLDLATFFGVLTSGQK
jgi:hypothetical protein